MRLKAKIRYRHPEQEAVAWQTEDGVLHVRFDKPQRAITRGQAVVLYDGDIVVGGGVIENCIKMTDFPCLSHFVGLSYLHCFLETL